MSAKTKAQNNSDKPEDGLKAKVEKWLNRKGFPLEYKTYAAFARRPIQTGLGSYIESKEGKMREIDVFAYETHSSAQYMAHVRVICECKYSRKKPWVLLYGNREKADLHGHWLHTPRSKTLEFPPQFNDEIRDGLARTIHFQEGFQVAHNLTQVLTDSDQDRAYDALRKVCHAAWDFIEVWEPRFTTKCYEMVFPCIVVDAPVYAASYDVKDERVNVKQIKFGRVCWQGRPPGTNVDVVHSSALETYAERVSESFMMELMPALVWLAEQESAT